MVYPTTATQEKIEHFKQRQDERLGGDFSEQDRQVIIELEPKKVLVVCYAGAFRSKLIAQILEERGYETYHIGVANNKDIPEDFEYEAVIAMSQFVKEEFKARFSDADVPIRSIAIPEQSGLRSADEELTDQLNELIGTRLDTLGFITKKTG